MALNLPDGDWTGLRTGLSFQEHRDQLLSSSAEWLDDDHAAAAVGDDGIMSDDQGWFRREPGQRVDGDLTVFWQRLREMASGWVDLDVQPTNTWFTGGYAGLELPRLTCRTRQLHLDYAVDRVDGARLKGEWSDKCYFDGDDDEVDLLVRGLELSPAELADIAGRWIEQQLRTPIIRQEWTSTSEMGELKIDRRRWVDGLGRLVEDDAAWPSRLIGPRRPPDREIPERPDRRQFPRE